MWLGGSEVGIRVGEQICVRVVLFCFGGRWNLFRNDERVGKTFKEQSG